MLKAKLDSVRKNKKGFSLVELIIVIAIMVALIAVMAPAFVKYVQKSRNSALTTAAESLYTAIQTYYGDPDVTPKGGVTATVSATGGDPISIEWGASDDAEDTAAIETLAGVDDTKNMGKATITFTITATPAANANDGYTFSMTSAAVGAPAGGAGGAEEGGAGA